MSASVVSAMAGGDSSGFARATEPRPFRFPPDAGPHPEFQTEWWYYTGNLQTGEGRRFGFQLTFFRRALTPAMEPRASAWSTNQMYFAHFAVSDIGARRFHAFERWSRGAAGLAGAQANPFRVWVEGWEAVMEGGENTVILRAVEGEAAIELQLQPLKPLVLQGERGLSRKSARPGNASYYYSQTRLATRGTVRVEGTVFRVEGLSWLDREWSTSALSEEQEGWDWFALQLDDGREIMLYQLRLQGGGVDPYSSGTLVERDGTTYPLKAADFRIRSLDTWTSPHTGAVYPARWRIEIPAHNLTLTVVPQQADQELRLTFAYWEGAVRVEGAGLAGHGYVELTGYASSQGEGVPR